MAVLWRQWSSRWRQAEACVCLWAGWVVCSGQAGVGIVGRQVVWRIGVGVGQGCGSGWREVCATCSRAVCAFRSNVRGTRRGRSPVVSVNEPTFNRVRVRER